MPSGAADPERRGEELLSFSVNADGTALAAGTVAQQGSGEAVVKFWYGVPLGNRRDSGSSASSHTLAGAAPVR